ncbi:hypothetical protein M8J77_003589 [Diaphorina citri]|nr:hypothetical protein M8J77_003589 [Diaphorina citri]
MTEASADDISLSLLIVDMYVCVLRKKKKAIEGSTFVIGNRIEYVRVIRDYLSQAQNRINNREKSAMFKKHNIYEEAIWK